MHRFTLFTYESEKQRENFFYLSALVFVELFGLKVDKTSKDKYLADLRLRRIGCANYLKIRLVFVVLIFGLFRICFPDIQSSRNDVCI